MKTSRFYLLLNILSLLLDIFAIKPKTFLPECKNIVAKNHEGYNSYLAHDDSRWDYCCMVGEGFHVKKDCEIGKPTTTVREPCPYGTFAEVSHGSQRCVPWACVYNDREIMFDRDSRQFKVTAGGSATRNIECSCTLDKYLYVDTDIEVAYCRDRVKVCAPGEGVIVQATLYSDIQCSPCRNGYFQSEQTKTGKCEAHTKCSGDIKVHGNATDDTECLKPGDEINPVKTTTTTTTTTTATTQSTTSEKPKKPTPPPITTKPTEQKEQQTEPQKDDNDQGQPFKLAMIVIIIVFGFAVLGVIIWCCCRHPSKSSKSIISHCSERDGTPLVEFGRRRNSDMEWSSSGVEYSSSTLASSPAPTPVAQTEKMAYSTAVREETPLVCKAIVEDAPSASKEINKYPITSPTKSFCGGHTEEAVLNNKAEGVLFDNVQPSDDVTSINEQLRIVENSRPVLPAQDEFRPDPRPINPDQSRLRNNPVSAAPQDETTWNQNITILTCDPDQITHHDRTQIYNRTEEICREIQLCSKCFGTVFKDLQHFARVCGISNSDIDIIWKNNSNPKDQFAEIIRKVFTDKGRLYTPEKFIRRLNNREDPNASLIDDIKQIIKKYDTDNPNGVTVVS